MSSQVKISAMGKRARPDTLERLFRKEHTAGKLTWIMEGAASAGENRPRIDL